MKNRGCPICPAPLRGHLMRLAKPALIPVYVEWRQAIERLAVHRRGNIPLFLKDWADDLKAALFAARGEHPCLGHKSTA